MFKIKQPLTNRTVKIEIGQLHMICIRGLSLSVSLIIHSTINDISDIGTLNMVWNYQQKLVIGPSATLTVDSHQSISIEWP